MPVPFADLQLQYQNIKREIDGAINSVIRDNAFIRGAYVDAFEREFAAAVDAGHCVSCANGTDALYLPYLSRFLAPGGQLGIVVPGLTAELDEGPPDHLAPYWEADFWAIKSQL